MQKSKDEIIAELDDKIKSLIRKRNTMIVEMEKMNSELTDLIDKKLSLDETKVRIICINCKGQGYVTDENGKKRICQVCNGYKYNWAERYIPELEVENK